MGPAAAHQGLWLRLSPGFPLCSHQCIGGNIVWYLYPFVPCCKLCVPYRLQTALIFLYAPDSVKMALKNPTIFQIYGFVVGFALVFR